MWERKKSTSTDAHFIPFPSVHYMLWDFLKFVWLFVFFFTLFSLDLSIFIFLFYCWFIFFLFGNLTLVLFLVRFIRMVSISIHVLFLFCLSITKRIGIFCLVFDINTHRDSVIITNKSAKLGMKTEVEWSACWYLYCRYIVVEIQTTCRGQVRQENKKK